MMQQTTFSAVPVFAGAASREQALFHWRSRHLLKTGKHKAAHPDKPRGQQWIFNGNERVQVNIPDDDVIDYYGFPAAYMNYMGIVP